MLVGGDAHIAPANQTDFTKIFGEFVTSQWGDVGIAPYAFWGGFPELQNHAQQACRAWFLSDSVELPRQAQDFLRDGEACLTGLQAPTPVFRLERAGFVHARVFSKAEIVLHLRDEEHCL